MSAVVLETPGALNAWLAARRADGERVVLTNGTFDVLHVGHVRMLAEARAAGDRLLVALNSDDSVRAYKGPARPLTPQSERAEILAALACVDAIIFFDEPTADGILRAVRPDVYAKGRDYGEADLPEAGTAREVGARIALVGDPKDHAASDIIARVAAAVREGRL